MTNSINKFSLKRVMHLVESDLKDYWKQLFFLCLMVPLILAFTLFRGFVGYAPDLTIIMSSTFACYIMAPLYFKSFFKYTIWFEFYTKPANTIEKFLSFLVFNIIFGCLLNYLSVLVLMRFYIYLGFIVDKTHFLNIFSIYCFIPAIFIIFFQSAYRVYKASAFKKILFVILLSVVLIFSIVLMIALPLNLESLLVKYLYNYSFIIGLLLLIPAYKQFKNMEN